MRAFDLPSLLQAFNNAFTQPGGAVSMFSSFSASDDRKKRVGSSAVMLLMSGSFCRGKAHHRQELREELGAEMPPRVPEEILRRWRKTTDRRAFQVRMELVDNDE